MKQYFFAALRQQKHLHLVIIVCLCLVAAGSALVLLKPSQSAHAQSQLLAIGPETIVYDHNTLVNKGLNGWSDGPQDCVSAGNGNIDCYSSNGAVYQSQATTKTSGTTSDPAQSVAYNHLSITNEPGGVYNYALVGAVYKDPSSGTLIGFVHLERDPSNGWQYFWASIGLAYSKDNGASWDWGGEIIQHNVPYNPNNPPSGYESGVGAYILYTDNGTQYFYVYMDDTNADGTGGVSVSRASVQQVLSAVNNGTGLPAFYKYDNGGWSSQAAWINGTGGTPQGGT